MNQFLSGQLVIVIFFYFSPIFTLDQVSLIDVTNLNGIWNNFKVNNGFSYANVNDENYRKGIFSKNIDTINKNNILYNNGQLTYTSGINKFADKTQEEFMTYVNQGISGGLPQKSSNQMNKNAFSSSLPPSVDWRTKNIINPIRNQGGCGSCWAFSAVSTLESYFALITGYLPNLSEQNLVDCAYFNYDGCKGGQIYDGYRYVKINNGIDTEESYPYVSGTTQTWEGKCSYSLSGSSNVTTFGNIPFVSLPAGDENALQLALANVGPISVAFYASQNFQFYANGTFSDTSCTGNQANHAVVLVGYDTDSNGNQFYILRNSWGTSWGMNGYMQFARNNNNMCSIASYAVYPQVASLVPQPTTTTTTTTTTSTTTKVTTTLQPQTTTTSSPKRACNQQYYADPGCQTYHYCAQSSTSFTCPLGFLFDIKVNRCNFAPNVKCSNPTIDFCPNGSGYYTYSGCASAYYCNQVVYNYTVPAGYLFDEKTVFLRPSFIFKCPI